MTATLTGSGTAGPTSGVAGSVSAVQRIAADVGVGKLRNIPSPGCAVPKLRSAKRGAIAAILLSSAASLQPGPRRLVNTEGSNSSAPVGYATMDRYALEKNGKSNGKLTVTAL